MTSQPSLLFVFGLGYSAQQLASRLMIAGWQVAGGIGWRFVMARPEELARMARGPASSDLLPGPDVGIRALAAGVRGART